MERTLIALAACGLSMAGSLVGGVLGASLAHAVGPLAGLAVVEVTMVLMVVTTPLWTLLPAVVYHDLRIEKEGVDTAELAKVFE